MMPCNMPSAPYTWVLFNSIFSQMQLIAKNHKNLTLPLLNISIHIHQHYHYPKADTFFQLFCSEFNVNTLSNVHLMTQTINWILGSMPPHHDFKDLNPNVMIFQVRPMGCNCVPMSLWVLCLSDSIGIYNGQLEWILGA